MMLQGAFDIKAMQQNSEALEKLVHVRWRPGRQTGRLYQTRSAGHVSERSAATG